LEPADLEQVGALEVAGVGRRVLEHLERGAELEQADPQPGPRTNTPSALQCVRPELELGKVAFDAPLLDHRIGAGYGPAPPIRRNAAPKQQ